MYTFHKKIFTIFSNCLIILLERILGMRYNGTDSEVLPVKEWGLLIWIPQFAISVASPLVLFLLLAEWLHSRWGWGGWVFIVGIVFGLITAGIGFRDTARAMLAASGHKKKSRDPGVSFNNHD